MALRNRWVRPVFLALATVFAMGPAGSRMTQSREGRDSITWPSERGEFPTLQSAINAVKDDGVVIVQPGRYEETVIIRNRRITMVGAGCDEKLPLSRRRSDRFTALVLPRPRRVVPFSEGGAVITSINSVLTLKRMKISGSDTSVRVMAGDGAQAERSVVTIEDVCLTDAGRGFTSSASAKVVMQNVLIRNVLWNGISISPGALGTGLHDSIFTSFGVTVLSTGNACVVVKNSLYTAFKQHLEDCGFNGGPPGMGAGLQAVNAGVNFIQSTVNTPNGPGIAATGSTTLIHDSLVFFAYGIGILLHEPLYAMIKGSTVRLTQAFPTGHFQAGLFGDGVSVLGGGTVWVGDTLLRDNARVGLGNWGGFADLGDTRLQCNFFNLGAGSFPTPADDFEFGDRGGVFCGCPDADEECVADSADAPSLPSAVNE